MVHFLVPPRLGRPTWDILLDHIVGRTFGPQGPPQGPRNRAPAAGFRRGPKSWPTEHTESRGRTLGFEQLGRPTWDVPLDHMVGRDPGPLISRPICGLALVHFAIRGDHVVPPVTPAHRSQASSSWYPTAHPPIQHPTYDGPPTKPRTPGDTPRPNSHWPLTGCTRKPKRKPNRQKRWTKL